MKIEVDMKEYERRENSKYIVYDKPNDILYIVSNFSCPATVFKYISNHYYDYRIDSTRHCRDFRSFWYNSDKPLTGQVYKNIEKQIQANLDS